LYRPNVIFTESCQRRLILYFADNFVRDLLLADGDNHHILLLDNHLSLRRVIDEHQLNYKRPRRLCYREDKGQLLVGLYPSRAVAVFDVLCR